MNKNLKVISIVFLGICIVISSWIIAQSIKSYSNNSVEIPVDKDRYEFIKMANDYIIIFDKQTGDYWRKIGSNDWEKDMPISH